MATRTKLKALDLFCGAGGASTGLYLAGFDVTGVDIKNQRRYPFKFVRADALEYPLGGYDFIWASPPCQRYSKYSRNLGTAKNHPDFVALVIDRLRSTKTVWVVENVPGAPLRQDLVLCGTMFGLPLIRHRIFQFSNSTVLLTSPCDHTGNEIGVYGGGTPSFYRRKLGRNISLEEKRVAMGIDWMGVREIAQAVPPDYSKFIAQGLLRVSG